MEVRNSTVGCSGKWIFPVLVLAGLFQAGSVSFSAQLGTSRNEVSAQVGRASLTVEDMKTLLGRKTRDPSSQVKVVNTDVTASTNSLKLTLSSQSVRKLSRTLAELEMKRIHLEDKLDGEAKIEIEKLREDRKKIQSSRISSSGEKETQLSRDLFDSFLSESNSKAKIEAALREFDEQNMITLEFVENSENKSIEAIYVGDELAWSKKQSQSEYARK